MDAYTVILVVIIFLLGLQILLSYVLMLSITEENKKLDSKFEQIEKKLDDLKNLQNKIDKEENNE